MSRSAEAHSEAKHANERAAVAAAMVGATSLHPMVGGAPPMVPIGFAGLPAPSDLPPNMLLPMAGLPMAGLPMAPPPMMPPNMMLPYAAPVLAPIPLAPLGHAPAAAMPLPPGLAAARGPRPSR